MLTLLDILSDGQLHAAARVQRTLGVTRRTLYRDIAVLTDCGFLVMADIDDIPSQTRPGCVYQLVTPQQARRLLQYRATA